MSRFDRLAPVLFLLLAPSAVSALDLSTPLPNWLDESRERKPEPFVPHIQRALPPSDFRLTAEYEPVGAVVISWAGYTDMLSAIARAASGPGKAQVWGVSAPESITGVPADKYTKINAAVNTVWARDYGPFGISSSRKKVGIVDTVYRHYQYRTDDDAMPVNLGAAKGIEVFGTKIVLDGGNVMVDSAGNLFMTKRTYIWNSGMSESQVDAALRDYFKVKNIHTFEYAGYPGQPADGTGHIDMFMKLLNDHTVLVSTAEEEPFKSNSEKAMAFFKGKTAPDGQAYKIITVKGWKSSRTWYTYTNSLLVNDVAIIPSYGGHAQEEAAAKAAYEAGRPGVKVVPVPSDSSITAGGSIHCVTQTIPAMDGVKLSPAPAAASAAGPVKFEAVELSAVPGAKVPLSPALGQLSGLVPAK